MEEVVTVVEEDVVEVVVTVVVEDVVVGTVLVEDDVVAVVTLGILFEGVEVVLEDIVLFVGAEVVLEDIIGAVVVLHLNESLHWLMNAGVNLPWYRQSTKFPLSLASVGLRHSSLRFFTGRSKPTSLKQSRQPQNFSLQIGKFG